MSGGGVAEHPATSSDASIAELAIFIVDLKHDVCVWPRGNGFPTLRANARRGRVSSGVFGGPYQRCVFAKRQSHGNDRRKAAGDNMLQVRAFDRHRMCRCTMDFTALVGGLLVAVMMLRRIRVVRRGAVMAHVVCRCLVLEMHPGLKIRPSVKTRGIGCGKQTRLKSRHDQEHDRQHRSERYVSQDRDSTHIRHRALGTIVRVICQVRVRKVCCNATKSERHCLLRRVCISISHQTQHRSGDNQITRNLRQGDDRDEAP